MLPTQVIMAGTIPSSGISDDLVQRLLDWHDRCKTLLQNTGSIGLHSPWIHTKIRDSDRMEEPLRIKHSIPGSPWNGSFIQEFPELVDVFNSLPFKIIHKIVILETIKECVPHIDGSADLYADKTLEPCNYRMLLQKSKFSSGFYVQAIPKEEFGCGARKEASSPYPKQYYSPDIGKWWVLNNWCCQHGSDWKADDGKVLISVVGTPTDQHREFLKSLTNVIMHPDYNTMSNREINR